MLNSINQNSIPETILPKANHNSSKDANSNLSIYSETVDLYASHTEDLSLKYTNKDGDKFEFHATLTEELYYHSEKKTYLADAYDQKGMPTQKGVLQDGEIDPSKQTWDEIKTWANKVKEELKQQQLALFKELMRRNSHTVDTGDGKFLTLMVGDDQKSLTEKIGELARILNKKNGKGNNAENAENTDEANSSQETAGVPAYWNAENTSNRIVRMAVGFAKISGLAPDEFAEKISKAVQAGFNGANEITGDLPGAAGKLNQETHRLTFEKLQKWLEENKSGAYNQVASVNEKPKPEVN